ncbi:exopolyphosphatase isoform X1 [Ricinus communis]|uniref:exopolyphosphatase isoform X1 n=1 Tax=Ricinus communis TaxID=3988 RepID=UPI00201AF00B|nr:exopolyphosphatase isoform X1 [Ricinus communis]
MISVKKKSRWRPPSVFVFPLMKKLPFVSIINKQNPPKAMTASSSNLFASIDMGTNSFKMLIIQADPSSGKFLTIDRHKNPLCLGRDLSTSISPESHSRALSCLQEFNHILKSHNISPHQTRCVATAAMREANNSIDLCKAIFQSTGLEVVVLTGEEEASFIYLGMLQFLNFFDRRVLVIDIGGGSTEFVIGERGIVIFAVSLKLGHVGLTQKFDKISDIKEFVKLVIKESGLVEKIKDFGFEVAVGTSGTIRSIEKAVFYGFGQNLGYDNEVLYSDCKRDWKFGDGELKCLVERFCNEGESEKSKRDEFFKRRSEFIIAGSVLLEEIFELLGIKEMEVSGYALGEGVIAEALARVFEGYDLNANARWRSVVRLATRFSEKKRIKSAAQCATIASEIFVGLRKWLEVADNQVKFNLSLDEKSLQCLEAACLLHNIGLCLGKKGHHKQTYRIIMNGNCLHGYSTEEVELIALLTRHHRKKFPESDHSTLVGISKESKRRFRILCIIIRISVILQKTNCLNFQDLEFLHSDEGFKLVFRETRGPTALFAGKDMEKKLKKELEQFKTLFQEQLLVEVLPCTSESSKR